MSYIVKEAQEETGALLANLMQGHADLVCTTSKTDIRPTYFAWNKENAANLERLSEMTQAFPVHDLSGSRPESYKPKGGASPIILRKEFGADNWASENRANFHSVVEGDECADDSAPAGFAHEDAVEYPTQFAWKRLDAEDEPVAESTEDDAAVEEEAAEVAQTESVEPVAASAGDNKDKNTSNIMNTDTSKFPSAVWRSVNRADFPLDADLAEPQMVAAGYAVKGSEDRPVYYAWDADRIEAEKAAQNDNEPTETEEQKGGVEVEEGAAPSPAVESGEAHDTEVETAAPVASKFFNDTFTGVRCSEYDSRFAGFDSSNYMNEHVSRNVKKSLDGIMNQGIEGVFGGISSEYNEKYAPSPSKAAAPVMVDESVAADLAMPELENITPAPAMDAPSEQGQESSEETQAAPAEVAETPVETEMCFETEASIPEEASVPVPTEAPTAVSQVLSAAMEDNNAAQLFAPSSSGANPTAWGSVSHATYTWPEVQAQKDAKANTAAPADGDMIGGTMGTAPVMDGALDERLTSQLKQENTTRFTSESQSKFNWPCFDMNKRAASKTSDSLWVVGTRGDRSRKPEPKAPAEPHAGRSDHEADFDHLRGAAAMPLSADTLDVMEEKFSEDPIGKPTKKIGRDVAGDTPRSDMPLAGMIPNEQNHEKLVSKDSVIPGQIPKLRSGPADRIDILNHMALPRPKPAQIKAFPNSAAAGLTTGMGVGNMLDPVRCYPRYPQLSAKQANRWATSSASAYKWPTVKHPVLARGF